MAAALLHKIIPLELFETRRLLGAVVAVIGLAVTWRLGRRVGGPLAGLATLLLLALCPTFYGHMFMNPKDAPFAVAMVILMLGLVRLAEEYPSPFTAHYPDRRPWRRPVGRLAHPRRAGALVYALIGFVPLLISKRSISQGAREAIRRFLHVRPCAAARPDPRLPHHGSDLAMVDHGAGQSVPGPDLFLALLREAVEGNVRRRAGVGAGHAVVISADPVRAPASRSAARAFHRRRARRRCIVAAAHRCVRRAARPSCPDADAGGNPAAGDCDGEASGALQRHPAFHLCDSADDGAGRRRLRMGNELAEGKPPQLAARRGSGISRSACCCRSAK